MAIFAFNISQINSQSTRPHIKVSMNGITNSWLYDTGAAISLIPLSEFRKIHPDLRPVRLRPQVNLTTASSSVMNVTGLYHLKLSINNRSIVHPVYVCENAAQSILGIDAIRKFGLVYSPSKHSFSFEQSASVSSLSSPPLPSPPSNEFFAHLSVTNPVTLPALTCQSVSVSTLSSLPYRPPPGMLGLAHVGTPSLPFLNGGPGLTVTDRLGEMKIRINNCSPTELKLQRGDIVGFLEKVNPCSISQINDNIFVPPSQPSVPPSPPSPSADDSNFMLQNLNLTVPENERQLYIDLILRNHDVFSKNKNDLGKATLATHKIHLKHQAPIYVKQFPVPEAYRSQLNQQVKEWLKMGIITPTNSPYNSPIFVVPKKDGSPRYVLDFRKLNECSHTDKYSMKTVDECIGDIGRSGSSIFSTLDLSSGFWQLPLDPSSQKLTAFTVQNLGQFQWTRTSQGLHSAPSQYQRLMELVVKGLDNIIVYIDDLLVHNSDHIQHRKSLQLLFDRLRHANLKLNLPKCNFGSENVTYLGFRLTPQGILPGADKLAAVKNSLPPTNVHQVRQFLGLANFFRTHIRNFSLIASPLNILTRKDTLWRGGPLPPPALQSFKELQTALCSEPVVNYPRKDRPYALIVDAASGNDKAEGGLGAVLCQADPQGELHVIAYASRSLSKHEKNYTPFLLEMTACTWGIEHFSVYLRGRKFTLYTDHKPLEKLSTVHTKTLNRLQQAMNEHDFVICHKPGHEMPADFLSRNVSSISSVLDQDLELLQSQDPFIKDISNFLRFKIEPANHLWAHYIKTIAPSCFFEKNILWRRMSRHNMPHRNVLLLPIVLADELIHDSHNSLLSGHEGITRTKERLLQSYFWPNMEEKISAHVTACTRCQSRRTTDRPKPPLLTPMPQCTSLNQRVAIDLMGPLRTSNQGKNFVLCMTDAFTKYAEVCAIPNKEAPTVARAIFEKWICRFGCPVEFTSDNGKEFCNELTKELFKLLNIKHSRTTPYHPQCNAQAEVQNKVIQKYLASFVDTTTLDWPLYMAPMAFAYNTALHRSIKSTPFFLTYGIDARLPSLPDPNLRRYYGQSDVAAWYATLHHCRQIAVQNNLQATEYMQSQFNKKAAPYNYTVGQFIWVDARNYLGRNKKLSPHWDGPFEILRVFENGVVEINYKNNKKVRVNVARIKPYIPPISFEKRETILPPPPEGNDPRLPPSNETNILRPQLQHLPVQVPEPVLRPYPPPPPPPPPVHIDPPPSLPPPPLFSQPIRQMGNRLMGNFPPPPPPPPSDFQPVLIDPQLAHHAGSAVFTPAPPPAIAPRPATAGAPILSDSQRLTRSLRQATGATLHPPLAPVKASSPFIRHPGAILGPSVVCDAFGLPVVRPGFPVPSWIRNRRKYLRKLPPAVRNFKLTGDPAEPFDPATYDNTFAFSRPVAAPRAPGPAAPPPLPPPPPPLPPPLVFQPRDRQFDILRTSPPRHLYSSSDSSGPPTPPSDPASPCRTSARDARLVDNAAILFDRVSLTERPGQYFLRVSSQVRPPSQSAAPPPSTSATSSSASSSRFSGWGQRFSRLARTAVDITPEDLPTFTSPGSLLTSATGAFTDLLYDNRPLTGRGSYAAASPAFSDHNARAARRPGGNARPPKRPR